MEKYDDIAKQREHFEKISREYFNARQGQNHLRLKDLIWDFALKDITFPSQPTILEPMCGYSEGKKILSNFTETGHYEAFDYSLPLVEKAKETYPNALIWHADITKVHLKENFYDIIILIGGLHHVPNFLDVSLTKIYSSLKQNGIFINLEPTQNFFVFKKVREIIYKRNPLFDEQTERAFDLVELNKAYQNSEFHTLKQFYPGLLSYILFYNPDAFPILNVGKPSLVDKIFNLEKLFFSNTIGKTFSFATLSILKKP